ncbi:MAG: AAA family ATPase [Desulfobacterales bacterium]|nr:AAA family ATPase [Desulfobacterales bacterium]
MIIVCPQCSGRHQVDPKLIQPHLDQGRRIKVTCKTCHCKFPVDSGNMETEAITRKLCVTLSKGGVGKTTTCVNLGAGLALAGYRVLIVDTDTQGQAAYLLGVKPKAGLAELLSGDHAPEDCINEARKNLWVLGGGRGLAGVKRLIDRKSFGAEWALAEALAPFEHKYDFILLDTSPGWDQLTVNVLFYAEEVLIPVALEVMPFHALAEFFRSLNAIRRYRKEVQLKYIVPTFLDIRVEKPKKLYERLAQLYPDHICDPVHYSEVLSDAPSFGKSIFEFAPGSIASSDYRALVRKVCDDPKVFA